MSLSDLPDDILGLISCLLNGFDNCSLWMASDSKLKQRLVNNVITDFDIKYTIPGRFLWPGNFLKKLKRLSRLSLVVHEDIYHLPIQKIKIFPIPALKYFKLVSLRSHQFFQNHESISSNNPTSSSTSNNKYINLNDYFSNLEYLEIGSSSFTMDFLLCLPNNLKTLSIPQTYFEIDAENSSDLLNHHIERLPRTLTSFHLYFDYRTNKPFLDSSKLPPNLTSLTTNTSLDPKSYDMIPKSLKEFCMLMTRYNFDALSPFLPTGLESLEISLAESPTRPIFTHLPQLQNVSLQLPEPMKFDDLITHSQPKLGKFFCNNLVLTDIVVPSSLLSNLTTLTLRNVIGISAQFISCLPQSLTDLKLFSQANQPFAFFSLLPRNLKSLATNFSIVEKTSILPKSLTFLSLRRPKSCDPSCFDLLPQKLETLIVDLDLSHSIMKMFPSSLEYLNVACDTVVDDEIVRMLPRGLKDLTLSGPDIITDAGVADLPPSLQVLSLSANTVITSDAIRWLPRTLTVLHLAQNQNLTDECVKHLPPKITSLYLDSTTKITSKSCKDLPKYLEVLMLPKCDWDPETLIEQAHELPQFVQKVYLKNQKSIKVWRDITARNCENAIKP